jgi:hypothetical protein
MSPRSLHDVITGPEAAYFGPAADTLDHEARERYRVWLAERGDDRAELLAIENALLRDDFPERELAIARAQAILTKSRFVRDWWRIVTRTAPIRNCGSGAEERSLVRFAYDCPRTWESLAPTNDAAARHCTTCERLVHLCGSKDEAEERARRGDCITLPAAEWTRISQELTQSCTGRPDPIAMWAERVFPDERSDE